MNNKTYLDTENKIIGNLLLSPLENKSVLQIVKETGLSYVTAHKIIPILAKTKLIRIKRQGKANLVSIDFEHAGTDRLSAAMLQEKNVFLLKHKYLYLISKDIEDALAGMFYTLILFGSYAKEQTKDDSDIDLLIIAPYKQDIDIYCEKINKALKLHKKVIDFNVISTNDFIEMLNQKYSVGRSAFQQGIVLFGAEQYYSMVKLYVRTKGY